MGQQRATDGTNLWLDPSTLLGDGSQANPARINPSALVPPGATFLGRRVFVSGAPTPWVSTVGATACLLRMVGGGGGGGGGQGGGAGTIAGGSGGSAGVYLEKWIDPGVQLTGGAIAIGAAGAGGSGSGAGQGGTGGDTTIVIQGVTYTAKGGIGGIAIGTGSSLTAITWTPPPGAGSSAADARVDGAGSPAFRLSGTVCVPGSGGSNPLGAGAATTTANVTGASPNPGNQGAGGAGAVATTVSSNGGPGSAGVIIVDEYA